MAGENIDFIEIIRDIRGKQLTKELASQDPTCIYGDIVRMYNELDGVDDTVKLHYDQIDEVGNDLLLGVNSKIAIVANDIDGVDSVVARVSADLELGVSSLIKRVSDTLTEIQSVGSDIDAINSIYSDKTTLDSIYADKITLDWLFTNKDTLISIYDDKNKLDSIFADKAKLDAIFGSLTNINTVATNILNVNSVATDVVPNIAEILQSDNNATIASGAADDAENARDIAVNSANDALESKDLAVLAKQSVDSIKSQIDADALTISNNVQSVLDAKADAEQSAVDALNSAQNAEDAKDAAILAQQGADASASTAQVHEIKWIEGGWTNSTTYSADKPREAIANKGSSYICVQSHTSDPSTEPGSGVNWNSYWEIVAASADTGGGMLTVVYDTNENGIVDDSEKLNNRNGAYYLERANHTGSQSIDTIDDSVDYVKMTANERTKVSNAPNDTNSELASKQDVLVNQTNIKSINGDTLLGAGDLVVSAGSGGYAANVYLTNTVSSTVGTYSQISYTPDVAESLLFATANNGEVIIEDYIFDGDVLTTAIPAGEWGFHFHRAVSNSSGDTKIRFMIYARSVGGVETELFSVESKTIEDTVAELETILTVQPTFLLNETDRIGIKVYANTTRTSNILVELVIGDGRAAYFTTPLEIRHSQLRARDKADSHPISAITNLQSELDGKADNATTLAGYGITDADTSAQVDAKIAGLVDSAPGTLDTLNELAQALGDDPNFATTITDSIATKIPLSEKGLSNGVAELNALGHVPENQLASGGGDATKYLRGDGLWSAVASGGGLGAIPFYRADGSRDDINIEALLELLTLSVSNQLDIGNNANIFVGGQFGWSDLKGTITTGGGPLEPTLTNFIGGIKLPAFQNNKTDEFTMPPHLNHDYAPGTKLYPHIHFAVKTTQTGTIRWGFEFTVAAGHQQAGTKSVFETTNTIYAEQVIDGTAFKHYVTEVGDADSIGSIANDLAKLEPDTIVLVRVFRDGTHPNDTFSGDAFGITADLHQQVGRFSTKNKSPDFYN